MTFMEVLIALSILLTLSMTLIPLYSFISFEKKSFHDKRIIAYQLHDALQAIIWDTDTDLPLRYQQHIEAKQVDFSFQFSDDMIIHACASWQSVTNRLEEVCFDGIKN